MRFFVDIGQMDRTVTIRNVSNLVTNDYGEVTGATNTDVEVNAAYSYAGKDEGQHLSKETQIKYEYFVIRYGINVTLESRLIYEGNVYDIVNIEPIGRKYLLKVKCKLVD